MHPGSPFDRDALLSTLQRRFQAHPKRHPDLVWPDIEVRLLAEPSALASLHAMEESGGEPDVIGAENGRFLFVDCAAETPAGRRSLCFDRDGWESRKEHRPTGSAMEMAEAMGVEMLDEADYMALQTLGEFDLKTSSWLATPVEMRDLGGALFGDRRFGRVFIYHNGAQSYYAVRGFRAKLWV